MKNMFPVLGLASAMALAMAAPGVAQNSANSTGTYNPSAGAAVSRNGAVNTSNNRAATNQVSPSPSGGGGGGGSGGSGGGAGGSGGAGGGSGR